MNYEKHLEELDKFREILSNTISDLEGLGVEFGNYMAQVEDMRDDYDARSNMDFDDGDHLTNKHKKKYTDKNGDTISNATLITNREYEEEKQDTLRKIRLLDPDYLEQFVEEFQRLISDTEE